MDNQPTAFDLIGGALVIRAITDRFYDLMDTEPAYAALRAMHAADLAPMRENLPAFLTGWIGGPRHWFVANPGKCMMSAHAPFAIGRDTAGQWAEAMRRAIAAALPEGSDPQALAIADALAEALERMALGMAREPAAA